ncbi:MAG: PxxKW family cysteine-rich protein [Proteobacteria bacterium]|nr:PxxKW family cysteine-rich protein [Pseudomonadota bacterium]MBU2227303.1 PxxKW family cysteine-rich protein [Pseudomonadota bacterium]MBU2262832.1 PxxKW family cysteine-rich protein [Pseudomonadota bacterium]
MICQTIKSGVECGFMMKKGCGFNGGSCHEIIDKCEGCNKVIVCETGRFCRVYPDPAGKWRAAKCPTASNMKLEVKETAQKINPLKASKRANKK